MSASSDRRIPTPVSDDVDDVAEEAARSTALVPEFDDLLLVATDIEPKLKALWTQVYRNAVEDRERAGVFLLDLQRTLTGADADKHSLHGPQAVRYLERIGRANEQLLKLAEQVRVYREEHSDVTEDDILDRIQTGG